MIKAFAVLPGVLLAVTSAAWGETLPWLGQVTGQSGQVRGAPAPDADQFGTLAPSQVVEVLDVSEDGAWGRIVWGEANGWLALAGLQQVDRPRLSSGLPVGLSCIGTEPFWTVDLTLDGGIMITLPGSGDAAAQDVAWSTTSVNSFDAVFGFGNAAMTGILRRATCLDGMSDTTYGWALDLVRHDLENAVLSGCCTASLP